MPAGVFLLPLAFWPGAEHAFSTPKLWLAGGLAAAVALRPGILRLPAWPWLLWLGAIGLSAAFAPSVSLAALAAIVLPLALFALAGTTPPRRILAAVSAASLVESGIALLQFANLDPLRVLGWRPEAFDSSRMRVYGTLGNPDFVAAWLCATLPLHFAPGGKRVFRAAAIALQTCAILATGSRVFLLTLPVLAVMLLPRRRWLGALPVAAAVLWLSPARPLEATVAGRSYLAQLTSAHLLEAPLAGFGPGAFALESGAWQVEWFRSRGARHPSAQFAGPLDHAHNDYLEFWVEYGAAGLAAFAVLCGWLAVRAGRPGPENAAIWCAAVCLALIAAVDFPFHRPAEWGLFWLLLGILSIRTNPQ